VGCRLLVAVPCSVNGQAIPSTAPPTSLQTPATPLAQALTSGRVFLYSVEDFDTQYARLHALIRSIHNYSYPDGHDARGRTLQQDEDEYLLPPATELRLQALRLYAEAENARGDGAALGKTLQEAQTLLGQEDYRARVLWTYAVALHAVEAQRTAWAAYADRVTPRRRIAGQLHIDVAATEYSQSVERALQTGQSAQLAGADQTQFLRGALIAAYNKERGALAAELSDEDREQGKLTAPYVRQAPCPPSATQTSGKETPYFGQALRSPAEFYPAAARRMEFEGAVQVRLWISETGCLERAEVWRSSGVADLDQAALQYAAEGVTWLPAEKDGKAVAAPATLPVRFTLR
jgi:TonB family protein